MPPSTSSPGRGSVGTGAAGAAGKPLVRTIGGGTGIPGICTPMLYVPSVELAVAVTLAAPARSVIALAADNVADGPEPGAL